MKHYTYNDILKKFLMGDLETFMRRYYLFNKKQLIALKEYPKFLKKLPESKKLFSKHNLYINDIGSVICIHKIMCRFYGFDYDIDDLGISIRLNEVFNNRLKEYCRHRLMRRRKLLLRDNKLKPDIARKELKARGFIKLRRFKNIDEKACHVITNANIKGETLYYPINLYNGVIKGVNWWELPDIHQTFPLLGLVNYTKIKYSTTSNTINKKQRKKRK